MSPYCLAGGPALALAALLPLAPAGAADAEQPGPLAAADRDYLDGLFRDFLFDPAGARRVRVAVRRGPWADAADLVPREAWLVPGKWGTPGRVYFADGDSVPAPIRAETVNFVGRMRRFLDARQPPGADTRPWVERTAREVLGDEDDFLALAAWLYRLGHEADAAKMLGVARALCREDPRDQLRSRLAADAFRALYDAFRTHADAEALARGDLYLKRFAQEGKPEAANARAIVADLRRRRAGGTFGGGPLKALPGDFPRWGRERKLAFLVASLEDASEATVRDGQVVVGFGDRGALLDDPLVGALIDLGEEVVPALIDVVEKDDRLTRWPVRGHRFDPFTGEFYRVRDAAESAVQSILRVRRFPPVGTDADDHSPAARAARMRAYWGAYGKLSFDERMMRILTDDRAPEEAWRQAAENLARWDSRPRYGPTWYRPADAPRRPNPVAARFREPTMAEAVLAALDRDWAIQQGRGPHNGAFHEWPETERHYLDWLVELGDARIGPELGRRAAASADTDARRKFAFAAHRLGASGEWVRFCRAVARGEVRLASVVTDQTAFVGRTREEEELSRIVDLLIKSGGPEADEALRCLADTRHRHYPIVSEAIIQKGRVTWGFSSPWGRHPFCLTVLRRGLDDRTPTGGTWHIRDDRIDGQTPAGSVGTDVPDELADPARRRESAGERACDAAGMSVSAVVAGSPFFHVLQRDPEPGLSRLRAFLDRYGGRFRPLTRAENDRIRMRFVEPGLIPDIRPLGRPATAADVRAGTAVFDLGGRGTVAEVKLPAWLLLKTQATEQWPAFGLVVQAEVGPDGKTVYGVIFRHRIRSVKADEVERIETYKGR